jgi:hypothetical protein
MEEKVLASLKIISYTAKRIKRFPEHGFNRREKMRKRAMVILLALLAVWPLSTAVGGESPWEKKLPFESATITYTLSGIENGTETLYIRNYGRERAIHRSTKTTMMGVSIANEQIEIQDENWIYSYDLTNRTGSKNVNPVPYMIEEYQKLSKEEQRQLMANSEKMGGALASNLGGKVETGVVEILGYSCDRSTAMGTTVYLMSGTDIDLRLESNMMGMQMRKEATSIKKGAVSDEFFKHPEGIVAEEDPESETMARSMAKQTIEAMKDPQAMEKMEQQGANPMMPQGQMPEMTPEEQEQMEQAMEMLKGMFGTPPQQ